MALKDKRWSIGMVRMEIEADGQSSSDIELVSSFTYLIVEAKLYKGNKT